VGLFGLRQLNAERLRDGAKGNVSGGKWCTNSRSVVLRLMRFTGYSNYGDRVSVGNYGPRCGRENERTRFLYDNPWVREEFDVLARQIATPAPKKP
jgi:hypothetical protein